MEIELPSYPPGFVHSNAIAVKITHTNMFGIQIGTYTTNTCNYAEVLHCADGTPRISYIPVKQISQLGAVGAVAAVAHIPRHLRLVRADPVPVD